MEGEYVSGTFNVKGQSSPLQNVVLLEDKLSFTASPRGFSIQFDGTVTKDTIRGKLLLPKGKSLPFEAQKGE